MPEAELSLMFLRLLNQLGIRYIVGGGVAAILHGEPRFTNDLDLVVFLRPTDDAQLFRGANQPIRLAGVDSHARGVD